MKIRIINILMHAPRYDLYEGESRPECTWDTAGGSWVGVWGNDWPDLLGKEVLKRTRDFDFEVWQPDIRADRVYECSISAGQKHILFPAVYKNRLFGHKPVKRIFSSALVTSLLRASQNGRIIVHVNDPPDYFGVILKQFAHQPLIMSYLGEIQVPKARFFSRTRNILSKFNNFLEQAMFLNYVNKIDVITYSNDKNLYFLKMIYGGRLEKLAMGCDFSYWRPMDRSAARRRLKLDDRRLVFLSSTNLIASKQIDKAIAAFMKLDDRRDYLYVISGHGTSEYEEYLKSLLRRTRNNGRFRLVGYVNDDELLDYYNAADFFLLPSQSEGSSVSIIKAMACGIPVISTPVGGTAELMVDQSAGCFLSMDDHQSWTRIFEEIIRGSRKVAPLKREIAKKTYDWQEIARKIVDIYRQLAVKHYGPMND